MSGLIVGGQEEAYYAYMIAETSNHCLQSTCYL